MISFDFIFWHNIFYPDEDDFVFTIEYSIDVNNQYLYEINYDKINSFKFYQNKKINEFTFYLDFSGRVTSDLNMNIKIYSNETIYSINSYYVDKEFIQKILNDQNIQPNNYNSIGNIKKYIQGGEPKNNIFTFAKLEISSDELKKQNNNNNSFIYTIFKLEEGKVNYKVKFDLYPYNIDNINAPLARNHLFIQKIPFNAQNYKLFLSKSDIYYNEPVKIDYVVPIQKKYEYYIAHTENGNENPTSHEQDLDININEKVFGKDEKSINTGSNSNKKKLIFNLIPQNREEVKEELLIFSYKNTKDVEVGTIYTEASNYIKIYYWFNDNYW